MINAAEMRAASERAADERAVELLAAEAADRRLKRLTDEAERGARDIHVADHMPIRRFFNAARTILQQARTLAGEQDLERAYVLLIRFLRTLASWAQRSLLTGGRSSKRSREFLRRRLI